MKNNSQLLSQIHLMMMEMIILLLSLQKTINATDIRIIKSRISSGIPGPVINQNLAGSSPTWIHLNLNNTPGIGAVVSSIELNSDLFETYNLLTQNPLFIIESIDS